MDGDRWTKMDGEERELNGWRIVRSAIILLLVGKPSSESSTLKAMAVITFRRPQRAIGRLR